MRLIPIHIARDGLSFAKHGGKARLTTRFHPCLDNERPSLAIYIGIRHIGCRIFTIYTGIYISPVKISEFIQESTSHQ